MQSLADADFAAFNICSVQPLQGSDGSQFGADHGNTRRASPGAVRATEDGDHRKRHGSGDPCCLTGLTASRSEPFIYMVLPVGIELTTSPLPMECSTTELRQPAQQRFRIADQAPRAMHLVPQAQA